MEETKVFWLSKRFWGGLFAAAGILMPMFGISDQPTISNLGSSWMNVLDAACQFGGVALAFWGGMRAKTQLTLRRS